MAATCQVAVPATGGPAPLQGADAECFKRAMAAMDYGGACSDATPSACSDGCKAELQSFTVTDACWTALVNDPSVSLLGEGEDYL